MYSVGPESDIIVVDVETTGVDPEKNAVVAIAVAVCDVFFAVKASKVFYLAPHEGAIIEPKAMAVNGLTELELTTFPPAGESLKGLNQFLFAKCAANPRFALWYCWGVGFDDKFLYRTYERAGVPIYSRRTWCCMRGIATHLGLFAAIADGKEDCETKNVRSFCATLGVEFEGREHDPMADVLNSLKVMRLSMARLMRLATGEMSVDDLVAEADKAERERRLAAEHSEEVPI